MDWECSRRGKDQHLMQNFRHETSGERILVVRHVRALNNIKMDIKSTGSEDVDWI